jgi:TolA-binding protein
MPVFKSVPVNTRVVARVYGLYSLLLALSSLSLLVGCATSQEIGKVQWQVNELKSEVKNIRQKTHGLDYKQEQKALEEEQKATSKFVSDLMLEVQSLKTEVQILTGRFEEARYFSEKNIKELTESKDELIAQIKELEIIVNSLKEKLDTKKNAQAPATKQVEGVKKTEGTKKTAGAQKTEEQKKAAPTKNLKDAYMDAYETYKSNNLKESRKKFQNLLEKYPENEFSDNARFWIKEEPEE